MPEPSEIDVCRECMDGDHESCRKVDGWGAFRDTEATCACHLTHHKLDNRVRIPFEGGTLLVPSNEPTYDARSETLRRIT